MSGSPLPVYFIANNQILLYIIFSILSTKHFLCTGQPHENILREFVTFFLCEKKKSNQKKKRNKERLLIFGEPPPVFGIFFELCVKRSHFFCLRASPIHIPDKHSYAYNYKYNWHDNRRCASAPDAQNKAERHSRQCANLYN